MPRIRAVTEAIASTLKAAARRLSPLNLDEIT
jgi:hypothetical protein